jgi:hypothetical protein
MINFRYHLVSIVAVFLALGIGVIMGSAVIDRAVVDRLERQQTSLDGRIRDVQAESDQLRAELRVERDAAEKLADEGSQRLFTRALAGMPVLVVGVRGAEADGLDELVTLLDRAAADRRGTLWLTERMALSDDSEVDDLARVLGVSDVGPGALRSAAISRLAQALRPAVAGGVLPPDPLVEALREAGFLDYDKPEGAAADAFPALDPRTRLVVLSGPSADVPDRQLMVPFVRSLLVARDDRTPASVLAVTGAPPDAEASDTFLGPLRDGALQGRLSTVDDIDDFAGRWASVLALADLGAGRFGHYGVGEGAQRLLPASTE